VTGADFGNEKRTNLHGAFHLACCDGESSTYQSICKIGTVVLDSPMRFYNRTTNSLILSSWESKKLITIRKGQKCRHLFKPRTVMGGLAADLSLSCSYTAGKILVEERGILLRSPRFLSARDGQDPEHSNSPSQVFTIFLATLRIQLALSLIDRCLPSKGWQTSSID
jgi:DNA ligase-1